MNKIQIIYSTIGEGQQCANVLLPESSLLNRDAFKDFCLAVFAGKYGFMGEEWHEIAYKNATKDGSTYVPCDLQPMPKLVKISTWVDNESELKGKLPDWYYETEGKFYWDDLNPGEPRPF